MEQLVEHTLKNKDIKIKLVLADGVYDTNKNFRYLQKKRIRPGIKVRKNSITTLKNNNIEIEKLVLR